MEAVSSSGKGGPVLAPADQEWLTVHEGPDVSVCSEEEPEPAQGVGGLGDQRAALDRLVVGQGRPGPTGQSFEAVALQLRAGASLGIDDQDRPLAVEEQRGAFGRSNIVGVGEAKSRRAAEDVGDRHPMGQVVRLDPGAAEVMVAQPGSSCSERGSRRTSE